MNSPKPTIADLNEQLKRIQTEIEERRASAKTELRADIEQMLKDAELTLQDVFPELAKGGKGSPAPAKARQRAEAAPKYKDPNSGALWSGRGRSPRWVVDVLDAQGISIEQFKSAPEFRA